VFAVNPGPDGAFNSFQTFQKLAIDFGKAFSGTPP
jgi:hypothetical protein